MIDDENIRAAYPNVQWKEVPATATGGKQALLTAYFPISSGTHTVTSNQDNAKFLALVYGAGDRETYGYMAGMSLKEINPPCTQSAQQNPSDGIDNDCDALIDEEFCDGLGEIFTCH